MNFDITSMYPNVNMDWNRPVDKNHGRPSKQMLRRYTHNGLSGITQGNLHVISAGRQCGKSTYFANIVKMLYNVGY